MDTETCSFCLDVKQNPVCIDCGHSFCQTCLESYIRIAKDARCPLCRQPFQFLFDTKDDEIINEISRILEESDRSQPDDGGSSNLSLQNLNFFQDIDDDSYSGNFSFEGSISSNGDIQNISIEIFDLAENEENEHEYEIIEHMEESDDSVYTNDSIEIDAAYVNMECDANIFICDSEDSSEDDDLPTVYGEL